MIEPTGCLPARPRTATRPSRTHRLGYRPLGTRRARGPDAFLTRLVPAHTLEADQAVRDGPVAREVVRERDDVAPVVEVDDVPARADLVQGLLVQIHALLLVAHFPRLVLEGVDVLVADVGLVQAGTSGADIMDIGVRMST